MKIGVVPGPFSFEKENEDWRAYIIISTLVEKPNLKRRRRNQAHNGMLRNDKRLEESALQISSIIVMKFISLIVVKSSVHIRGNDLW